MIYVTKALLSWRNDVPLHRSKQFDRHMNNASLIVKFKTVRTKGSCVKKKFRLFETKKLSAGHGCNF